MKILIAESERLIAEAFIHFIKWELGYYVRHASDLHEAHHLLRSFQPDVVVLGSQMHAHGPEASIQKLKRMGCHLEKPKYAVIIPSIETIYLWRILQHGASALIHDQDGIGSISECLLALASSQPYLSPRVNKALVKVNPAPKLTPCELRIARLLVAGESTRNIARLLCVSQDTIQNHRKNMKQKFGIRGGKKVFLQYLQDMNLWETACGQASPLPAK